MTIKQHIENIRRQNYTVAFTNPEESKYTSRVIGIYSTLKGARIACKSIMRKHEKSEDSPNYSYRIDSTFLPVSTVKR